jgi:hypothetical protein
MPVAPSGNDQLCNTPNKRPCLQRDLDSGQKTNVKHKGFPDQGRKTLYHTNSQYIFGSVSFLLPFFMVQIPISTSSMTTPFDRHHTIGFKNNRKRIQRTMRNPIDDPIFFG